MFIAMNRFMVKKGSEEQFEHVWKSRIPISIEFPALSNSIC